MLCVPSSLNELLVLFESCFTRPTFETFCALVVGQVSQTRLRCVTGMLVGARLSGVWHHARCHRFFANARWSADELGLRLAVLIVERFTEPGASVLVAVDDTLLKRRGRRIHGTFWHHDATANSRSGSVAWGNNWVCAGICVKLPFLERTVCLPVLFRLWQPRRKQFVQQHKPDPERPGKVTLARELVCLLATRLPGRMIDVVGDSAYISQAWRGVGDHVRITSRLRVNATLYAPAPPRTGKRGRPREWGERLATLKQLATSPATKWAQATVRRYNKTETLQLAEINCLWEPLGSETPVRVILVKDPAKPSGYQIALITTDPSATPAQIVERYADRWPIEVAFQDGKEIFGIGDARNRTEKAVQRTVPFQFLAMDLTTIWYAIYGHHPDIVTEHRARAPWYVSKTTPSFQDMLAKLRRVIIATQFQPQQARTPTTREISAVQQAWAAAGL
ncbi:transposase [Conexibacter sp. S30A1]|uniref:IS701 family transposase n=1 Tax=Conexibacter sp. S30A1 TaxID=2937800 RepID=UPI00200DB05E|nr:transposase [Conexibacter sp. S30A1]